MEFLLKYSTSGLSNRIILLAIFLFVICVSLWNVITNRVDLYKRGKALAITVLLFGWVFSVYYIYDSLKGISELNEISKESIEQYYNIEKIGDTLLFSEKGSYKTLEDTFLSNIKTETYSDYVLIVNNRKVLIPKNIVK